MHFKGSLVEFTILQCVVFLSLEDIYILMNSADPMKCHILWHFIWAFTVCQSTPLGIPSIQSVNRSLAHSSPQLLSKGTETGSLVQELSSLVSKNLLWFSKTCVKWQLKNTQKQLMA